MRPLFKKFISTANPPLKFIFLGFITLLLLACGKKDSSTSPNVEEQVEGQGVMWSPRGGLTALAFNNRLWLMGGVDDSFELINDVWSSADGKTWRQETAAAEWQKREGYGVSVFNNRIWLIGGYFPGSSGRYTNDTWSSADGKTWQQETAKAEWSPRRGHRVVVLNNRLWLVGGYTSSFELTNDVWSSTDGKTWRQETEAAAWGTNQTRDLFEVALFNDRLWMMGGKYSEYTNDIWSSADGKTWQQESAAVAWSGRRWHAVTTFDRRLWVIGGSETTGGYGYTNDSWSSGDGITWKRESAKANYPSHYEEKAAVVPFQGRLWLLAGQIGNTEFTSQAWSSADGKTWRLERDGTKTPAP